MQCSVLILCKNQRDLNVPFPEDKVLEGYTKISTEIMECKKRGKFYVYDHAEWPFICDAENVCSVLIRRELDGQKDQSSQEGPGQEAG